MKHFTAGVCYIAKIQYNILMLDKVLVVNGGIIELLLYYAQQNAKPENKQFEELKHSWITTDNKCTIHFYVLCISS
jgi:hypothetical protein